MSKIIKLKYHHTTKNAYVDDLQLDLNKSLMVVNHSPDGFNIGYGGSGPAQLALAILLEYMEKEQALVHYQQFKRDFIENMHLHEIDIPIEAWINTRRP